jgi:hypothetical protein
MYNIIQNLNNNVKKINNKLTNLSKDKVKNLKNIKIKYIEYQYKL